MQRVQVTETTSFSRLIYGMWRLHEAADTSPAHIGAKIRACLDQGLTTFDQADIYGDYGCEALLGAALKADPGLRRQMELITKCDICFPSAQRPGVRVKHYDTSAAHIGASLDRSLQNMHTDQIDCLLLHRPDPLMNAVETGAALDALVKAGKVKTVGVSNFRPWDWRLLQAHMDTRLVTNQIEINPLTLDAFVGGRFGGNAARSTDPPGLVALGGRTALCCGGSPSGGAPRETGGAPRGCARGLGFGLAPVPSRAHPARRRHL